MTDWVDFPNLPQGVTHIKDLLRGGPCPVVAVYDRLRQVIFNAAGETTWYCAVCGGLDVEPGEARCNHCHRED